ncbi:MAG: glycosyltransferase family 4 protein [Dehalococcoidia bacterium]
MTGEYPPMVGGIADYTEGLVTALRERGDEVTVLADRRALIGEPRLGVRAAPGWRIRRLPALARAVRSSSPEIVHIQYQAAAFALRGAISLLPALLGDLPTVVTFHDTREPYIFPKAGRIRRWANAKLAGDARAAICTNFADAATLLEYGQARTSVIPLGNNVPCRPITPDERSAARASLGATGNDLLVGHFGMMGATKGVETLVEAIASIPQALLALIGAAAGDVDPLNQTAAHQVEAGIASHGVGDRVAWSGLADLPTLSLLLQSCDLIALPYLDGASYRRTSLIAALANGCAVITTAPAAGSRSLLAGAGLPELRHGEALWLVPPGDAAALAQAITRLASNPDERRTIAKGGQTAASAFDWARIAGQHRAVYRSAIYGD